MEYSNTAALKFWGSVFVKHTLYNNVQIIYLDTLIPYAQHGKHQEKEQHESLLFSPLGFSPFDSTLALAMLFMISALSLNFAVKEKMNLLFTPTVHTKIN